MKCYFAFGDDIINNEIYIQMLKTCLASARQNTALDLYCLYDGQKDDKLYKILTDFNVNIIIASIPFKEDIYKI
jgi:hypothetical protein